MQLRGSKLRERPQMEELVFLQDVPPTAKIAVGQVSSVGHIALREPRHSPLQVPAPARGPASTLIMCRWSVGYWDCRSATSLRMAQVALGLTLTSKRRQLNMTAAALREATGGRAPQCAVLTLPPRPRWVRISTPLIRSCPTSRARARGETRRSRANALIDRRALRAARWVLAGARPGAGRGGCPGSRRGRPALEGQRDPAQGSSGRRMTMRGPNASRPRAASAWRRAAMAGWG